MSDAKALTAEALEWLRSAGFPNATIDRLRVVLPAQSIYSVQDIRDLTAADMVELKLSAADSAAVTAAQRSAPTPEKTAAADTTSADRLRDSPRTAERKRVLAEMDRALQSLSAIRERAAVSSTTVT
jgi:hypothetical protein